MPQDIYNKDKTDKPEIEITIKPAIVRTRLYPVENIKIDSIY